MHGQLKNFKALKEINSNKMLPHVLQDYRIVAAILNCFYASSRTDIDSEIGIAIAKKMKERENNCNILERIVNRLKLYDLTNLEELSETTRLEFDAKMTIDEIQKEITLGEYQIGECHGYLKKHYNTNGDIKLLVKDIELTAHEMALALKNDQNKGDSKQIDQCKSKSSRIFYVEFHSRHKSATIYSTFVQYQPTDKTYKYILGWFCQCKIGSRTIGCCSHCASIIYYLAIGRYSHKCYPINYIESIKNAKGFFSYLKFGFLVSLNNQ